MNSRKHFLAVGLLGALALLASVPAHAAVEYDRVVTALNQLVHDFPQQVSPFVLGTNDQGQAIQGIRIEAATPPAAAAARTNSLLVGTHHGNERLSADVSLTTARKIAQALANPALESSKSLIDQVFYVIPVLNIGGFNRNNRYENTASGKTIDPNRDYPDACVKEKANFQLKDTKLLADFVTSHGIVATITVHGYLGTFTYPWGINTDNTRSPDDAAYEAIANEAVQIDGYRTGTHTDVLYATAGAYEDWVYDTQGLWVMLMELANSPDLDRDSDAMIKFFELAPRSRSQNHVNLGHCLETKFNALMQSRP
ncbi:MAG TPA: M14 family zinc carboxypeptidase [Bdellovibrionota bacterium]|jgi:hypothetical protein|nr:M14 family zinc carboxypeptidase [Bdellovibrionota bacterium]